MGRSSLLREWFMQEDPWGIAGNDSVFRPAQIL